MTSTHGGRRAGAGRKRLTLKKLVDENRFDPKSDRHGRLLDVETFELDDDDPREELLDIHRAYLRAGGLNPRWRLADQFARAVL